ncbi:MAG: hypothetical protein GY865_20410 [candidate division Zixibacteria bacterium]|nr:hypothetical protein [candidate division Zixibacteria bacterium]
MTLLLNAKVSDRIIVLNDPVNKIDPLGLWDMMSSYQNLHNGYRPPPIKPVHYNRNQFNQNVTHGVAKETWDGSVPAYYHQQGAGNEGNQKFVSPDGHSEAIFDSNNNPINLQSNPVNGPTYNYQDPRSNPIGHFFDDMLLYFMWGNTPDDPSSIWERITGTYDDNPCK